MTLDPHHHGVARWVLRMQELIGRLGADMNEKPRFSASFPGLLLSCSPSCSRRHGPSLTDNDRGGNLWMMNPSFDLMPSELASFSPCFLHGRVRSETKTCRARRQDAVRNYQDLPRSMSQYQARVGVGISLDSLSDGKPRGQ